MHSSYDLGETKIGKANNPLERYKQGRTFNRKLALYGAFFIPTKLESAYRVEAQIAQTLVAARLFTHDDTEGEWFLGSAEALHLRLVALLSYWYGKDVYFGSDRLWSDDSICWLWVGELEGLFGPPDPLALELMRYGQ